MRGNNFHVVSSNVKPWCTIAPDTKFVLHFNKALDPRSAQAGIRFSSTETAGDLTLSKNGKIATWSPAHPLTEGEHTLLVEDVFTADRRHKNTPWQLPFRIASCDSPNAPYGRVLLHRSRTQLRMSDKQFSVSKLIDPDTDEGYLVATGDDGKEVDFEAIIAEEQRAFSAKYGKLHPTLYDEMSARKPNEQIPVAIWLAAREEFVDKGQFELDPDSDPPEALTAYRSQNRTTQERFARTLIRQLGADITAILTGAPVILTKLTSEQIREIEKYDDVRTIFLHEPEGIIDLGTSMAVSNADDVVSGGWQGTGVRIAVWENGPDTELNLAIADRFENPAGITTSHARLVTGIIRNRRILHLTVNGIVVNGGYAPRSRIYSANSMDNDALDWAVIDRQCRVLNQSFHRRSEARDGALSFDDLYKDYLVIHYPYPTIVQAAGNYWSGDLDNIKPPSNEFVNHKGYNSLSVGNHNDDATAIDGTSVFRNPETTHGDRELPELCANGTNVTAVGLTDTGTSFASPAVAGAVALLQSMDSTLASWPEGSRAILLAGTVNVRGKRWAEALRDGVDARDGAGALDVEESGRIARSRSHPDNTPLQRGWDIGRLRSEDFERGMWRHSYKIKMPERGTFRGVKIALAWNKDPGALGNLVSNRPTDFDLHVYDEAGVQVAASASIENSYEVAEFIGKPGMVYTVRIRKWSGNEDSYFGIAWSIRSRLPFLLET